MSRQAWLGSFLALAAAVTLIVSSRSISEFLYSLFFKTSIERVETIAVATLTDKNGLVSIRRAGKLEFIQVKPPADLNHLDQIKTERSAKAEIKFKSNWHLDIQENTIATIELYRPSQIDSPVLLSITKGGFAVIQPGTKGKLFIMRDKKVFSPESVVPPPVRTVQLPAHPSLPSTISTAPEPEPLPDIAPNAAKSGKMPDKIKTGDEETLSSSYIEQSLNVQSASLRKCQLNSLRDNKASEGSLLLSLTIAPNGKIDRIKILQDNIKNDQLTKCATSVIERVQFKSFEGLPITLTYPLEFR